MSRQTLDTYLFQSSPAPKRGRYLIIGSHNLTEAEFQSSPAPKRGRYSRQEAETIFGRLVSILTRAEARALLKPTGNHGIQVQVSILTRAEARALHPWQLVICQ